MRYDRPKSLKEAAEVLNVGHRKLHAQLVQAGALVRDARLPCWRASTPWIQGGWLREREYKFYNQSTGREQWAVKVLVTEGGLTKVAETLRPNT